VTDSKNILWHPHKITKEERMKRFSQKPVILWFTGLSGSGKSTIANALEEKLFGLKACTYLLDGDNIRYGLNRDLGFTKEEREENIRRIGEVSKLFVDAGMIVITAFISPFIKDRELVKNMVQEDEFIEIFIDTPIEICEQRDPKGLYKKARNKEIKEFTGISSPYEKPIDPKIHLQTDKKTIKECVDEIIKYLKQKGYISA